MTSGGKQLQCSALVAGAGTPSDACLRRAAAHILHDANLLRDAWENRHLRIGYTLWFITTRALWDFFFKTRKKGEDDINAADYTDKWADLAPTLEQESPDQNKAWRDATNKLAAHLTYSRVEFESEDYQPSRAMHDYLLGVFAVWLDLLTPDRRVWFGR